MPRYIRISILEGMQFSSTYNGLLTISHLEILNAVGTNLALNRSVSVSSQYSSQSGSYAVDNNTNTYWATAQNSGYSGLNGSQWLVVDLGASFYDIKTINLYTYFGGGYGSINRFRVDVSDDGTNFVTWITSSNYSTPGSGVYAVRTVDVSAITTDRYLLQHGTNSNIYTVSASFSTNQTDNPVVTASSEYPGLDAYQVYDGNLSTGNWRSGTPVTTALGPQWIALEFYTALPIQRVIMHVGSSSSTYWPRDFTIEATNDDIEWTVLKAVTDNTFQTGSQTFDFANTTPYKKYRIVVTRTIGNNGYANIGELKFYTKTANLTLVTSAAPNQSHFTSYGITDTSLIDDTILDAIGGTAARLLIMTSDYLSISSGQRGPKIYGTPSPRVVFPNGDISIASMQAIKGVTLTTVELYKGIVRVIVSVDSGVTWKTWNDESGWVTINKSDLAAIKATGCTANIINTRTRNQWSQLIGESSKIRFAYYLDAERIGDQAYVDQIQIAADMKGVWRKAIHGTDYDYEYSNNTTLTVYFFKNGDYKINY